MGNNPIRWRVRYYQDKLLVDDLLVVAPTKESALMQGAEYRHWHHTEQRRQVPFANRVVCSRLTKATETRLKTLLGEIY